VPITGFHCDVKSLEGLSGGILPTGPAVPSAVASEERRQGNAPSKALEQWTHPGNGSTRTARGRGLGQHQAELGLGWMAWLTHVNSR
jgi:hypothetical protein